MQDNNRELLAWAAAVISRECGNHSTGKVVVNLHEGVIQRVQVEKTERPPKRSGQ